MWKIFYYDKRYDKREIAEFLGIAVDTFHAYCNGDLRLHIDVARAVATWIAGKNPKDRDLIDYLLPEGFVSIPILKGNMRVTLNEIIDLACDVNEKIKKEGEGK